MRTKCLSCPLLAALLGMCWKVCAANAQDPKARQSEPQVQFPAGVWRGESLCATGAPSCHDERVGYYIDAIADHPGAVFIRAEKRLWMGR